MIARGCQTWDGCADCVAEGIAEQEADRLADIEAENARRAQFGDPPIGCVGVSDVRLGGAGMTARKTAAEPQDGTTRATAMGTRKPPAAKPLRPTPDVPLERALRAGRKAAREFDQYANPLTFADIGEWHTLKHAPATAPGWDATWLVVALMLLACLALGYIAGAFGPGALGL